MGFLKNAFGDNRVLTAKDPKVREMLVYMDEKYNANIIEYKERKGNFYVLRCGSKKYFDLLYHNGILRDGAVVVPGRDTIYDSKVEAYEGLLWLCNFLEGHEENIRIDNEIF